MGADVPEVLRHLSNCERPQHRHVSFLSVPPRRAKPKSPKRRGRTGANSPRFPIPFVNILSPRLTSVFVVPSSYRIIACMFSSTPSNAPGQSKLDDRRISAFKANPTMDILLPVPEFLSGFTTCPSLSTELLTVVSLDDHCLGVHKITRRTTHEVVEPPKEPQQDIPCLSNVIPPPTLAWEAKYQKGSINPSAPIPGGFGFYLSGPSDFLESLRCGAQEVLFSYRMMLSNDWDWMKGGKLPGICESLGLYIDTLIPFRWRGG